MYLKLLLVNILILVLSACQSDKQEQDEAALNAPFANVFQSLDGRWEGVFYVYEDTLGQRAEPALVQTTELNKSLLESLPLKVNHSIEVVHIYESDSPYYQRGKIIDTYTEESGNIVTIESEAVNKVENGRLYCIVEKPDDYVVHHGSLDSENFIIWQRNIESPLKVEYFKEKAEGDTYSIIGWGYYGEDDPSLSPKTWFYGEYQRE